MFAPQTPEEAECATRENNAYVFKNAVVTFSVDLTLCIIVTWIAISIDRRARQWALTAYLRRLWGGFIPRLVRVAFDIAYIALLGRIFYRLPSIFDKFVISTLPRRYDWWEPVAECFLILVFYLVRPEVRAWLRSLWIRIILRTRRSWEGAGGPAREKPKSSAREEPPKQEQRWSTADAEADYDNALKEAKEWADQAVTKESALARIRTFEKKSKARNVHPKDALRYKLAIMLIQGKLSSLS